MAETVYLNDGSVEVILTDKADFFERLLRERLGDDAARCLTDYFEELKGLDETKFYTELAEEHERSADGYLQLCHEAVENIEVILKLLQSPRLDRKALIKAAETAQDAIYTNI